MNIRSPLFIASALSVLASALIGHAQPAQTAAHTSASPIVAPSNQNTSFIEGNAWTNVDPQPVEFARQLPKLNDSQTRTKLKGNSNNSQTHRTNIFVHKTNTLSTHPTKKKTATTLKRHFVHQASAHFNHQAVQVRPQYIVTRRPTITQKSLKPARQQQHADLNLYWLSRAIEAEAGAEPQAVKLAVADVILNRVHSSKYPNSVKGVLFQQVNGIYAFTSVENGWIYRQPSSTSVAAAKQALYGHKNIVPSALIFYNNAQTAPTNWVKGQPVLLTLGAMTFAR